MHGVNLSLRPASSSPRRAAGSLTTTVLYEIGGVWLGVASVRWASISQATSAASRRMAFGRRRVAGWSAELIRRTARNRQRAIRWRRIA
jgi:hypothetical protein